MNKSIEDLEMIAKMKGYDQCDLALDESLTPITLNVSKVV